MVKDKKRFWTVYTVQQQQLVLKQSKPFLTLGNKKNENGLVFDIKSPATTSSNYTYQNIEIFIVTHMRFM